jgi:hypothetical protein
MPREERIMHELHTQAPSDIFWQRNIIGHPCEGKERCARCLRRAARYRFFKLSAAVPFEFQWHDKSLCLACADHVGRCGPASGQALRRFSMSRHHLRSLRGPAHDVYSVDYDHVTMDRETGDQEWYSVVVYLRPEDFGRQEKLAACH